MTSTPSNNIPDSISNDDLQRLMNDIAENQSDGSEITDEKLQQNIISYIDDLITDIDDRFEQNSPLVQKLAMLTMISNMIAWHTNVGVNSFQENDECGVAWLRDAGKWQTLMQVLQGINMGPNDWTTQR